MNIRTRRWSKRGKKAEEYEKEYEKEYLKKDVGNHSELETKIDYLMKEVVENPTKGGCFENLEDKIVDIILKEGSRFRDNEVFKKVAYSNETDTGLFLDGEFEKIRVPIQVDMNKIIPNGKELDKHIAECNGKVMSIINKISKPKGGVYNFIYVTQRYDGMVTVVGKTSFIKGGKTVPDLYKKLNVDTGVGTENIILRTIIGNEIVDKIDIILTRYYKKAWIVPIFVPAQKTGKLMTKYVESFEEVLGDELLSENIQILNHYSHKRRKDILKKD